MMLKRKIEPLIEDYLLGDSDKILLVNGARQIGKSFIVRHLCRKHFPHYVEINMADDFNGPQRFLHVRNAQEFYVQLGALAGAELGNRDDTIIFIDEIQIYPTFLTMLKSLREDNRFRYIASGSLLGVTLRKSTFIPIGSIITKQMYPLDFEEYLWGVGVSEDAIGYLRDCYRNQTSPNPSIHQTFLDHFKHYLLVGGLPDAVVAWTKGHKITDVRLIQNEIFQYYKDDAAQYDGEHKLKISSLYGGLISTIESKVKRVVVRDIEHKDKARSEQYRDEFDYLDNSGIALRCKSVAEARFPVEASSQNNLLKFYFNDVGILTNLLYKHQINAVLQEKTGVNLGAVYETAIAGILAAKGYSLFYFDTKKMGEVDFLINDYDNLCPLPIEVKSGAEGYVFHALPKLMETPNYHIGRGVVLSNDGQVVVKEGIVHLPIYMAMFL